MMPTNLNLTPKFILKTQNSYLNDPSDDSYFSSPKNSFDKESVSINIQDSKELNIGSGNPDIGSGNPDLGSGSESNINTSDRKGRDKNDFTRRSFKNGKIKN